MIYCANCGFGLQNDATFCPECGTKNEKAESSPIYENSKDEPPFESKTTLTQQKPISSSIPETGTTPILQTATASNPNAAIGHFQHFLKVSFPDLIKKVLFDPLDGTKKILSEIKEPVKIGLYCILISAIVIPLLIYLRIPSDTKSSLTFIGEDFFSIFIKLFFLPVIGALVITFFSFLIKAINNSQTANFGNEILTGGIVSLGYAIFFLVAFLLSYIVEGSINNNNRFDNYGRYSGRSGSPTFLIIIIFSTFIYLFVITSNSLSQSLRASGVKDGRAFYLSPFLIIFSAYITVRLWIAIFGSKYNLGFSDIFDIF